MPLHIVEQRRGRLHALIRQDGFLPLAEICRVLRVSPATARRDLSAIEANGLITRTHGGALADYNVSFASIGERAKKARTAKTRIAIAAAREAPFEGTIFIDAGTTTLSIARLLARRKNQALAIVTNSIAVASVLGGAGGVTLHLLGGEYLHRQATLFGDRTIADVSDWSFDAVFLGGEAMDSRGIWNSHDEVVRLERAVLARAAISYFCLDASKLGHATPHFAVAWADAGNLISDATPAALRSASINLGSCRHIQAV
ncbi:MAG: DeoR/GlpR family DNA-binding transcription regulator [Opitutaceae bacterium]